MNFIGIVVNRHNVFSRITQARTVSWIGRVVILELALSLAVPENPEACVGCNIDIYPEGLGGLFRDPIVRSGRREL